MSYQQYKIYLSQARQIITDKKSLAKQISSNSSIVIKDLKKDKGDHERFRIPKETIYQIDKESLYTTLTENQILETSKNDPFWTSMGSYTSHMGHEK
jgi:hypothetical protein